MTLTFSGVVYFLSSMNMLKREWANITAIFGLISYFKTYNDGSQEQNKLTASNGGRSEQISTGGKH